MALVAAVSFSCNKENIEGNDIVNGEEIVLYAPQTVITASSTETKTTLSGLEILWEEGDVISLFNENGTPMNYNLIEGAGTTSGKFEADLEPETGYSYAVYPSVSGQASGKSVEMTVAANQTYVAEGFSTDFPMGAVTSDGLDFTFSNLATVLSLPLQGDAVVRSISIEAVGGEGLAGAATVDFSGATPVLAAGNSATVTLDCGESGVQLSADAATVFNFILIPGEYSGLKVSVTDVNGHVTERSTGDLTLVAGSVKNFSSSLTIYSTPQDWNLTGSAYGWGASWIDLKELHGLHSYKNLHMTSGEEFKILWAADWSNQAYGSNSELTLNKGVELGNGQDNLKIKEDGIYDIYFDEQEPKYIFVMNAGNTPNFGIVGDINEWGNTGIQDTKMTMEDGYFVAKNITFPTGTFKIRLDNAWEPNKYNFGPRENTNATVGQPIDVVNNDGQASQNIIVFKFRK